MDPAEQPLGPASTLAVQVVYCPAPGVTDGVALQLASGSTLLDAVLASGLVARHQLELNGLRLGVWGKPQQAQLLLRERDRVEIYRPLTVDPKEARRLRYKKHRQRQAPAQVHAHNQAQSQAQAAEPDSTTV